MTKKGKFDVAVAAFEALLSKNELWEEYFQEFRKSSPADITDEVYTSWKEWALICPTHQWIAGAFIWDKTPQRRYTWREIDYQWLQWICRNINK